MTMNLSPDDSLIVVFQISITDNIKKAIEDLYIQGQEHLNLNNLSDTVTEENEALGEYSYYRDILEAYMPLAYLISNLIYAIMFTSPNKNL